MSDIPSPSRLEPISNHRVRRVRPHVQRRIDALKIGQKMQDLPENLWHDSFKYYMKEDPDRKGGPNLRLIRLDPDKPSLTVTGYIFNKFIHPRENRFITVREAARLQGFPDDLRFSGSLTSSQRQVGNAVPAQLAKAVFDSILAKAATLRLSERPMTALSLFSGAGGMDIGADRAKSSARRIETKVALDNWHDACETLAGYYGSRCAVREESIEEIARPETWWREASGESRPPDLIFGGPPCQAFSQAGKQKGLSDSRGGMIFEFLRFVESLRPAFFVMENVSNLKGVGGGALCREIERRIEEMEYHVTVRPLLAADYGAPQLRKRLLFLGCRKEFGVIEPPSPTHGESAPLPYAVVGDALAGLPPPTR